MEQEDFEELNRKNVSKSDLLFLHSIKNRHQIFAYQSINSYIHTEIFSQRLFAIKLVIKFGAWKLRQMLNLSEFFCIFNFYKN